MMAYCVATRQWEGWSACIDSWLQNAVGDYPVFVISGKDILPAFTELYEHSQGSDILAYLHDDLVITEKGWDARVLHEFEDPQVGIVGFGGALGHASPSLYSGPYYLPDLARRHFMSNMLTAEEHGARFAGSTDAAVLDGFSLFVRRELLDRIGGWKKVYEAGYYLYTEALCCEARRLGYRIRMVGVACNHLGGKTSTTANITEDFEAKHRWLYDSYRDVLPFEVQCTNQQ